ncbi:MAG: hypothetical protein H6931_17710 [Burkholderiaceae bacterium]|nr:hypothetical protein [Zoogloeaceae bacterium]MCP5290928.1 hypothetical protein [Burkholderiaceae bacterium]
MHDRPDAEYIDDSAATWVAAVYKLLADDPGSGGDEGALTRPHIEHALRARYLRDRVDATDATAAAHLAAADPHGDRAYADALLAALPASQGEVDAGVDALRAVTPATLAGYIGPRTTIDPAGITRLLGGLQLRFGAIPAVSPNTVSPAYAFAPAFPSECLALIPVAYSTATSAAVSLSRYSVSAAQYQVHNPSTTTVSGWYVAIGR